MGHEMPGWFDLRWVRNGSLVPVTVLTLSIYNRSLKPPHLDDPRQEDEKGIMESVNKIHGLVNEEAKHVPSERIVVGGFSQGAAVSLLVSLTTEKKVRNFQFR
jgi:predicted esterase